LGKHPLVPVGLRPPDRTSGYVTHDDGGHLGGGYHETIDRCRGPDS
jgi:hypothetical protein